MLSDILELRCTTKIERSHHSKGSYIEIPFVVHKIFYILWTGLII